MTLHDEDVRNVPKATPSDRGLCRERAPAGHDDDVRAQPVQRGDDAWSERVVVVEHPLGTGNLQAAEKGRAVVGLDPPGTPGDRAGGV